MSGDKVDNRAKLELIKQEEEAIKADKKEIEEQEQLEQKVGLHWRPLSAVTYTEQMFTYSQNHHSIGYRQQLIFQYIYHIKLATLRPCIKL